MSTAVFETLTKRVLDAIKEGEKLPWQMPWKREELSNPFTGTVYAGYNQFLLAIVAKIIDRKASSLFATFKQLSDNGYMLNKGSKGYPVMFFSKVEKKDQDDVSDEEKRYYFCTRYYTVFNLSDTDYYQKTGKKIETVSASGMVNDDAVIQTYINSLAGGLVGSDRAYYLPSRDEIGMPMKELFVDGESYYQTLYHEVIHSTGHETRLNRVIEGNMRKTDYSKEELIAEFGSCLLCHELGKPVNYDNSSAYIQSWYKAISDNPSILVWACSQAEKAVKFIVNGNGKE